jgi:hypothetical protein
MSSVSAKFSPAGECFCLNAGSACVVFKSPF